jgi:hypothetical protein
LRHSAGVKTSSAAAIGAHSPRAARRDGLPFSGAKSMDVEQYLSQIEFRFLQPQQKRPGGLRGLSLFLRKFGVHVEMLNTRLPEDEQRMRRTLAAVCKVPRMSTFAIGAIINRTVAQMPDDQCFVNIGVWNGFTFLAGLANNPTKRCVGVDRAFLERFASLKGPAHTFCEMGFDEYFDRVHKGPIGFCVYDGGHSYRDQYEGLERAEPFFAPGCLILVDDTNWEQVRRANTDFMEHRPGRYEVIFDRTTSRNCHPTFWNGVMMMRFKGRDDSYRAAV